ncbi:MAG: hypothetical protein JWN15_1651 [Firmicutes bacterium]|nr:hypothetical protein [Bacillota bacterium]
MLGRILRSLGVTFGRTGPGSTADRGGGGSGAEQAEVERLRQWVLEQLRTHPLKYLEQVPEQVEPVGPGIVLGGQMVDHHAVRMRCPGGGEYMMNVSKMHWMLRGRWSPEVMEGCLAHMLRGYASYLTMNLDSWEAIQPALLPVVKGEPHPEAVAMPWGSLTIHLAADMPQSMVYVSPGHIESWGRSPDEVLSVALANASRLHAGVTVRKLPREEAGGWHIWAVEADPNYSATAILLPHVVDQVPVDRADMYVVIPDRSRLFFIEKPGLGQDRIFLLRAAIQMYEESNYAVSPFLHVWSGDRLAFATAQEITGGDQRFLHDGGVLVPGIDSDKPMLVHIPEERQTMMM